MSKDLHQIHPEVIQHLKHAQRHLRGTIAMIEAAHPCPEVAQQLHTVEKAVAQAKRTLIHDHIGHCLEVAIGWVDRGQRATVEEFKEITLYL